MYARTVFDPLTIILPNGSWAPYLAQSVVPNATYWSWTIDLRPGVMFHDGTPLDGAALLMNFEAHLHSLLGRPRSPAGRRELHPDRAPRGDDEPQAALDPLPLLPGRGDRRADRLPDGTVHDRRPQRGDRQPVGTGPFKFTEWIPNDHFTATANPNYWRPGLPYLHQVTYKPIPDDTARLGGPAVGDHRHDASPTLPKRSCNYRGNHQWSYVDDSGPVVGEADMNCVSSTWPSPRSTTRRSAWPWPRPSVHPPTRGSSTTGSTHPRPACSARHPLLLQDRLPDLQPGRGQETRPAGPAAVRQADLVHPGDDQQPVGHPGRRPTWPSSSSRWGWT